MNRKKWNDLSSCRRTAILTIASVELSLTATAAVDLWCRSADEVRGRKIWWWLTIFIQPVGPIAYLVAGRKETRT